jgi:hypothetical protein
MKQEQIEQSIEAVMLQHDQELAAAERALFAAMGVNPDDPAVMTAFLEYDAAMAKMWRQTVQLVHDRATASAVAAIVGHRDYDRRAALA